MAASRFVQDIKDHWAYLERLERDGTDNPGFSYELMQQGGMLRPFTVRLPIPYLAVLDELAKYGPWRSKQEMVFRMIESAYLEFREGAGPDIQKRIDEAMGKASDAWNKKNKDRVLDLTRPPNASTKRRKRSTNEMGSN